MQLPTAAGPPVSRRRDLVVAAAIYLAALLVYWYSPVTIAGDSKYTLLLTQDLLSHGSFVLDGYGIPRNPPVPYGAAQLDGRIYQIEQADSHLYYFFPPGSSILSAPFVLVQDALGKSVVGPDGSYDFPQEERDQHFIAAALMAALAAIFYLTARLLLPMAWSVTVALGAALGTQLWSTASRGLWNHTWGVALLGTALYLLLAHETGRRKLPLVLLATLLSWAYFVRPTNSLFIVGLTAYLLLYHREGFWRYALTGAAWFAGFAVYSWAHFGHVLPAYFAAARLSTSTLPEALAGNLVSPSRGLLIFVPVVLFVLYLAVRFRRELPHRRLLGLAAAVGVCHYVAISGFVPWYGGGCYGPRYTTELVPWLVVTVSLGLAGALRWRATVDAHPAGPNRRAAWRVTFALGGVLLLLSVLVNARGATARAVKTWNQFPVTVDKQPARVWSWRYPQILAGIVGPPLPDRFPVLASGQRVSFGDEQGRAYQYDGWRGSDPVGCWSADNRSTLIFAVDGPAPGSVQMRFRTYLFGSRLPSQRVKIRLNHRTIVSMVVSQPDAQDYTFPLPDGALQPGRNFLTFDLPDAASPASVGDHYDERNLGVMLDWLELDLAPPGAGSATPTP